MTKKTLYILSVIALIVVGGIGLGVYFSNIFTYVIISLILSTLLKPLTNYLHNTNFFRLRLPRFVAVLFSFTILFGIIASFIILFIPLISDQIEIISSLNFERLYGQMTNPVNSIEDFLEDYNLMERTEGHTLIGEIRQSVTAFNYFDNISNLISNTLTVLGNFFIAVLAILFITFFLLQEDGILKKLVIAAVPNAYFEVYIAAAYKIEKLLSNYLLGLLLQMVAIFSLASLGLGIVGIKYALTIAVFAAVANLIPYAGPLLGSIFGIAVGLLTTTFVPGSQEYYLVILKVVIVFSTVQVVDNMVLQPLIFSKSVKAHPLEIFVIIFAGAKMGGVLGMIAAIPVYTIMRVFIKELYDGYRSYYIFRS